MNKKLKLYNGIATIKTVRKLSPQTATLLKQPTKATEEDHPDPSLKSVQISHPSELRQDLADLMCRMHALLVDRLYNTAENCGTHRALTTPQVLTLGSD